MTTEPTKWRKSTFSGQNGDCVELAEVADTVVMRNSNHPDRGDLTFPRGAVAAFVTSCAAGECDDLG
jgi:hypothetical protein